MSQAFSSLSLDLTFEALFGSRNDATQRVIDCGVIDFFFFVLLCSALWQTPNKNNDEIDMEMKVKFQNSIVTARESGRARGIRAIAGNACPIESDHYVDFIYVHIDSSCTILME